MTGEQARFMLERHGDMLWRLSRRLAGVDGEDLFQETFLRAMAADIKDIEDESARNLLYTICLNAYRSQYAKRRRRGRLSGEMPEGYDPPGESDTALDAQRRIAARDTRAAVARLPDKYRLPIEMFYFAGWSSAQIAQALGAKDSAVRTNLRRARKKLEAELEEWL